MAYVSTGLFFMLLPGTFLGVWNLLQISGNESAGLISPAWLQAHGHAQVFGWIGSFIFGIGFYSIPKLRGTARLALAAAWVCWAVWTAGVAMRWAANVYYWHWRTLLPLSAALELAAFAIFFVIVSQHRPDAAGKDRMETWIWVVASASMGLLLTLAANLAECIWLALRSSTPALPHLLDQRYLILMAWGFLVPFVWGFSAKWMQVFLGLRHVRAPMLLSALAVNFTGVVVALAGWIDFATGVFVISTALAIGALRMFESPQQEPKTRGVHKSMPVFVRMAYGWLLVAAILGVAAARWDTSGGIWGASRHALTVGFVAIMVFCVGQRILPAFAGMRLLWNTQLMFAALALLSVGCLLRVSCEILAYQGYAAWAWSVLPTSAMFELAGVSAFAANIFGTFLFEPSHRQKQPVLVDLRSSPRERTE
ncbi:MAG TPA: NnrS family protein [Candidatus Acidoferrales bacterium]|nr:NnrS family protein [Candidatus Acidoferrales bacterium]